MTEAVEIRSLTPIQAAVRSPLKLHALAASLMEVPDLIALGCDPVELSVFEDGRLYCHNGHHRVAACYLAGRRHLAGHEYRVTVWSYAQYEEICWEQQWITPFHPATEVRHADLTPFRTAVDFMRHREGKAATEAFIRRHGALYKGPRACTTFMELAALAFSPGLQENEEKLARGVRFTDEGDEK